MRKLVAIFLTLALVLAFSACAKNITPSQTGENTNAPAQDSAPKDDVNAPKITRDKAISLALADAGLDKNSVWDLEAELDYERGVTYWEVDFETKKREYSYDINADTGEIIWVERERD